MNRARLRIGRRVLYYPTTTEVTAHGAGPYPAAITEVNSDGTVDLDISLPTDATAVDGTISAETPAATAAPAPSAALADPLVTTANGSDPATTQALANANKVAINLIVTQLNKLRALDVEQTAQLAQYRTLAIELKAAASSTGGASKSSVVVGGGAGQCSLFGV